MSIAGFPTSSDIYLEVDGTKVAVVQSYTAKAAKTSRAVEAFGEEDCEADDSLDVKTMLTLAVATSIDALAVGITFAFLQVEIVPAVSFIGVTTFILSAAGVRIGNVFGSRWQKGAQIAGGLILICLGVKILVEHLGLI